MRTESLDHMGGEVKKRGKTETEREAGNERNNGKGLPY